MSEEGLYGKRFFVCSLVTTSLSCDRQRTALTDVAQVTCPDRGAASGHDVCSVSDDDPAGVLSSAELDGLGKTGGWEDSNCCFMTGAPLIFCFPSRALNLLFSHTDVPDSSWQSMFSGSDSSELLYSTRRLPAAILIISTGVSLGWTQGLNPTCPGWPLDVSANISPAPESGRDFCSESWQSDTLTFPQAAVKPCQSALRYLRYRTKYSRKQVSVEMRKSRRMLWSNEMLRSKSRKWQWGLHPEAQAASNSEDSSKPDSLQGEKRSFF